MKNKRKWLRKELHLLEEEEICEVDYSDLIKKANDLVNEGLLNSREVRIDDLLIEVVNSNWIRVDLVYSVKETQEEADLRVMMQSKLREQIRYQGMKNRLQRIEDLKVELKRLEAEAERDSFEFAMFAPKE